MQKSWTQDASFVTQLTHESSGIHDHDMCKLDISSRLSTATPSLCQQIDDQEEGRPLTSPIPQDNKPSSISTSPAPYHATSKPKVSTSTNAKEIFRAQKPAVTRGTHAISKFLTSSGRLETIDVESKSSNKHGFCHRWKLEGWRFGVFAAGSAVTICLVVELIMLTTALIVDKRQSRPGELYVGDCGKVNRMTTTLAILLNVIATVLIATSNYVMQCLSAPSRKDIDRMHAAGSYLNIGASSIHNLLRNPSIKTVLWLSLVLTSIPIHLLFNSAFFSAVQANNYGILISSTQWNDDSGLLGESDLTYYNGSMGIDTVSMFLEHMALLSMKSKLDYLDKDTCFERYSSQLSSTVSNVIIVVKQESGIYSLIPNSNYSISTVPPVDPFTTFELPVGVGLFLSPLTGNAVPVLNPNYTQTSAVLTQNVSGGLYLRSEVQAFHRPAMRSVFTAFDYHYWTIVKKLNYDYNDSDILRARMWSPTSWMCNTDDLLAGRICTLGKNPKRPEPWLITPAEFEVDHCLSQPVVEQCSLQYSWIILTIVICCDLAKIVAISLTLFMVSDPPLATLGDAVASFLERPDLYTQGCCLLQQSEARSIAQGGLPLWQFWTIVRKRSHQLTKYSSEQKISPNIITWSPSVTHWSSAPSRKRWILFGVLYVALLGGSLAVLGLCVRSLHSLGIDNPFDQGFGSINPNALFANPSASLARVSRTESSSASYLSDTFTFQGEIVTIQAQNTNSALFSNVLFANTPQLLFSMLYFLYNGLLTSMFTAAEWTRFGSVRKALRVSTPRVGQRSTYWLQLPWKYSLPILLMSIVIHWLVSRSLFLVRINVFSWQPQRPDERTQTVGILGRSQSLPDRDVYACGYSPLAILLVIIVVVLSLIAVVAVGRRKYPAMIPMCGTNSLAISAACHYSEEGDSQAACRPLMWGVTWLAKPGSPGHCSISDGRVEKPVAGMQYR